MAAMSLSTGMDPKCRASTALTWFFDLNRRSTMDSSFQRIHVIHVRRFVMPVNRDDEREACRRFCRRDANRENHKHDSSERLWMLAETPEGDEVQVRRVEHQLDADEHEDSVAPRHRTGQADG